MTKMITKFIEDDAVTNAKLAADVAGDGLQGASGTALSVKPKTLSGIAVTADGVAVVPDATTVGLNGSGQLGVVAGSIGATQLKTTDNISWSGTHNFESGVVTVPSITGLSDGNAPATKDYVDTALDGLSWKTAVRVATTEAITLSGTQTIDTIALSVGDRVLVKDQAAASANGIYEVSAGAWVRTTDSNTSAELVGSAVGVYDGSLAGNLNKRFIQTNKLADPGVTDVTYVLYGAGESYTAGVGIDITANEVSVVMGAGLKELPTGEVGLDLATNSGLTIGAGGAADQLAIDPNTETGATVVPINLSSNGAGVLVDNASVTNDAGTLKLKIDGVNETHLDFGSGANQVDSSSIPADSTYTAANYTVGTGFSGITNHLKGIDDKLANMGSETTKQVGHIITAGNTAAGYIDISGWTDVPANARSVRITPKGGPEQANYAVVGGLSGVVPDFELDLTSGSEKIIIGAAGNPTVTLSGDLTTGDVLFIEFAA